MAADYRTSRNLPPSTDLIIAKPGFAKSLGVLFFLQTVDLLGGTSDVNL
jgi:hypothetical protein